MNDQALQPPGTPFQHMSRTERINRKDELRTQREELRNAARKALAEQGFTKAGILHEMRALAQDTVAKFVGSSDMKAIMGEAVRKEVDRQLSKIGTSLESVVRDSIRGAAQAHAAEYIKDHVVIGFNAGGRYPEGGTF